MAVQPFLPVDVEHQRIAEFDSFVRNVSTASREAKNSQQHRRIVELYKKSPWLSPGIATSYSKWQEQLGTPIARDLARETAKLFGQEGSTPQGVQDQLEEFIARSDFQTQIANDVQGWWNGKEEWKNAPKVQQKILKQMHKKSWEQGGPQANPIGDLLATAGEGISVLPGAKEFSRNFFMGLESPYQELQAGASKLITAGLGAAATTTMQPGAINPLAFGQQRPVLADIQRAGAAVGSGQEALGISSGAYPNAAGLFGGVSTGAIALEKLIQGEPVDTGEGFFPGGEVVKQHQRAVRNVAALTYKDPGEKHAQLHYATPGRIFAASVTEPGTDPFNVLSGSIDAISVIAGDPVLRGGGYLEDVRAARKTFTAEADRVANSGGIRGVMYATTHGPTVTEFLDHQHKGAKLINWVTNEVAGRPETFGEVMRRTDNKWPVDLIADLINTPSGDRTAVRNILGSALGAEVGDIPKVRGFAAAIRNTTGQMRFFAEIPAVVNDLRYMDGKNGTAQSLYNHAIGIGLTDEQISTHLHSIVSSTGKVERGQAIKDFMAMEADALKNMGLPDDEFKRLSSFALSDLDGKARVWYDNAIAAGDHPPGTIVNGEAILNDGPFLQAEYLGNRIILPPLLGPQGRNRAIAKYGRILGIPGTGYTDLEGITGIGKLAESSARAIKSTRNASNIWWIDKQNKFWKPLALLRGAWTVRVIGEEQVRMAMSGYDSLFKHPLRYMMMTFAGKDTKSSAEQLLLDHAGEQGALRHAQEAAYGLDDQATTTYENVINALDPGKAKRSRGFGRIRARNTKTWAPDSSEVGRVWADKLITYHEDDVTRALARHLTDPEQPGNFNAVLNTQDEFWDGALAGARADLSTSDNLARQGYDLSVRTNEEAVASGHLYGADHYIEETFGRIRYYTGGDPKLINVIAHGKYMPDIEAVSRVRSLTGQTAFVDDQLVEVIEHKRGNKTALVMYEGNPNPEKVSVSHLTFGAGSEPSVDVKTRTAQSIGVDQDFVAHLDSLPIEAKPPKGVSGTIDVYDPEQQDALDRAVRTLFAGLMDIPTTKLSRGPVFIQAYLNETERLLPHMTRSEQQAALDHAAEVLHQADGHNIRGAFLHGRFKKLQKAATNATEDGLTFDEVDDIAKAHGLDSMRELLYDSHKRNRTLAAMQLVFPFGEAFKEMISSWGRIVAQKPITIPRKFQLGVTAAYEANPFDYLPGGTAIPGMGFFYKDPQRDGETRWAFPFSGAISEALFGVPAQQTASAEGVSMGLSLMPGVGPVGSWGGSQLLNRFMSDPKWDPLREAISPYASKEPVGLLESFQSQFAPSWMKKWIAAIDGDIRGNHQSAKALNGLTTDIMDAGFIDGTYDGSTRQGIQHAQDDAYKKARLLYLFQGTFQVGGAPAAPSFDFYAKTKDGKTKRFVTLRDTFYKMVEKDIKNGTSDAAAKFTNRFGENALYIVGPKTLGGVLGMEYTEGQYNWIRRHPDIVKGYPNIYAELAPRPKKGDKFSYDAWTSAYNRGEKDSIPGSETALRVNDMLGGMWYDKARRDLGLKPGESGSETDRRELADTRTEISKVYPGFRQFMQQSKRWLAVEELTRAAYDPAIQKYNPKLVASLQEYLALRTAGNAAAKALGYVGDFQKPAFSSGKDAAPIRQVLREEGRRIGKTNAQFMAIFEDIFDREMKDDD